MQTSILMALPLVCLLGCRTATEPRKVPEKLQAKALDFETKKLYCAQVAKTDSEFADCVGVKWETLQRDQSGLHDNRNAKGELHAD